mgnify:CR=1 FL=1
MLYTVLLIIHVIISVALILVVLIQSGQGGGLGGMLGGAAAQNVLGGKAAPKFLQNATKILAVLFMISCFVLVFQVSGQKTASSSSSSAVQEFKKKSAQENPQAGQQLPVIPEEQPKSKEQESNK